MFLILIIAVFSCKKSNEKNIILTSEDQYIKIISSENDVWLIEYDCLYSITPFDVLDLKIDNQNRLDILAGKVRIKNSNLDDLECWPTFKINDDEYKDFIKSTRNFDNIDINSIEYSLTGLYIYELINRGYIVTFSDDEGRFYVKK